VATRVTVKVQHAVVIKTHSFARKDYGTSACSSFERAKHENTFSTENKILVLVTPLHLI
jgi:hypothetical protein